MTIPASKMAQSSLEFTGLLESRTGAMKYMGGSRIFEQGDPGDCAFMIDSGFVEVSANSNGSKRTLGTLGPGEIFGEMALLDGQPRSATATALHETTVIPISRGQLMDEVDRGSPIVRLVLIAAINRLRDTQATSRGPGNINGLRPARSAQADSGFAAARANAAKQVRLRFELENAIAMNQFELAYQPIFNLADGRTTGFEALVRWPRANARPISPAEFIPLAEDSGLIVPLGLWILQRSLQTLANIKRKLQSRRIDRPGLFISVNVSPRQLDNEDNVEQLARMIEKADVDPESIKLEITEEALLNDPQMAFLALGRLNATGASIAIDDFGTGYSSLNYLHQFPLDTLKIDRSFVTGIHAMANRQRVVTAIINLARDMGMDIVAEGIEELEELRWLQSQGCKYGQGYFMAKPCPFTEALTFIDRNIEW